MSDPRVTERLETDEPDFGELPPPLHAPGAPSARPGPQLAKVRRPRRWGIFWSAFLLIVLGVAAYSLNCERHAPRCAECGMNCIESLLWCRRSFVGQGRHSGLDHFT